MRTLVKRLMHPALAWWYNRKNKTIRHDNRHGIQLTVLPTVFHPKYFLSTDLFIHFLSSLPLQNKRLLELGAGSGLIACYAAKAGAVVTASDINPKAVECVALNAANNNVSVQVLETDLLTSIAINAFDYVIINPPYYPKSVRSISEAAFYCGEDFEYFTRLFTQLSDQQPRNHVEVFMILSEDCQIAYIRSLAAQHGITFREVYAVKSMGERNWIYRLEQG